MFSVFYDMDPQVCRVFHKDSFADSKGDQEIALTQTHSEWTLRVTLCTLLTLCAGEAGCPHVCDHWGCSHCRPGHGGQRGGGRMLEGPTGSF